MFFFFLENTKRSETFIVCDYTLKYKIIFMHCVEL